LPLTLYLSQSLTLKLSRLQPCYLSVADAANVIED
jgi:hypothetical protein